MIDREFSSIPKTRTYPFRSAEVCFLCKTTAPPPCAAGTQAFPSYTTFTEVFLGCNPLFSRNKEDLHAILCPPKRHAQLHHHPAYLRPGPRPALPRGAH